MMKLFRLIHGLSIILLMNHETFSCTFFYVATDKKALFGSNEDWISAEAYVWFCPPTKNEYGRIFFGFELYPGKK